MKYYKDENNQVYAFEADGSQDNFIPSGLVPISEAEADALRYPEPSPEEQKQLRIDEIKSRLNEIDLESVRPLRAKVHGAATPEDDAKLAALEQEAEALRAELAGLNR